MRAFSESQGKQLFPNFESILMENVEIGRYSKIKKAIIDKNVVVPPNSRIGFNREEDERRGFHVFPGV